MSSNSDSEETLLCGWPHSAFSESDDNIPGMSSAAPLAQPAAALAGESAHLAAEDLAPNSAAALSEGEPQGGTAPDIALAVESVPALSEGKPQGGTAPAAPPARTATAAPESVSEPAGEFYTTKYINKKKRDSAMAAKAKIGSTATFQGYRCPKRDPARWDAFMAKRAEHYRQLGIAIPSWHGPPRPISMKRPASKQVTSSQRGQRDVTPRRRAIKEKATDITGL